MPKVVSFKKYRQVVEERRHPKEFKDGVKHIVTWAAKVERDHLEYIHKKWGTIAVIGEWLLLKADGRIIVMKPEHWKKRFPNPQIIG